MIYEHYVVWGICLLVVLGVGLLLFSFLSPSESTTTNVTQLHEKIIPSSYVPTGNLQTGTVIEIINNTKSSEPVEEL